LQFPRVSKYHNIYMKADKILLLKILLRHSNSWFLGPKDCTVRHFWEIIIQHKVEVIVMLCNLQECSNTGMMKDKCARYWPADTDQVKSIRKFIFYLCPKFGVASLGRPKNQKFSWRKGKE